MHPPPPPPVGHYGKLNAIFKKNISVYGIAQQIGVVNEHGDRNYPVKLRQEKISWHCPYQSGLSSGWGQCWIWYKYGWRRLYHNLDRDRHAEPWLNLFMHGYAWYSFYALYETPYMASVVLYVCAPLPTVELVQFSHLFLFFCFLFFYHNLWWSEMALQVPLKGGGGGVLRGWSMRYSAPGFYAIQACMGF